jgi:hypothetical protein
MMTMRMVEDSYQVALKEEENLAKKKSQQNRGRSPKRGKGTFREKSQKPNLKMESITVIQKEEEVLEVEIWWNKLFSSRKRKSQRRRSEMLCLWKDMAYVLGLS